MITNKNKTSIYNDRRFQTSRKQKRAACAKTLFTLSDYFQKQQNPARARLQLYSEHDEHAEVQLYSFFIYQPLSTFVRRSYPQKRALLFYFMHRVVHNFVDNSAEKGDTPEIAMPSFIKNIETLYYNDFSCFCGYAAKKRWQ